MDAIDKELKDLIDNHCCISEQKHLYRLGEGSKMWEKCAKCQTAKTGEGYDTIPPSLDWIAEDEECKDCEVVKWFKEHG